jgi:hypothetical protein
LSDGAMNRRFNLLELESVNTQSTQHAADG